MSVDVRGLEPVLEMLKTLRYVHYEAAPKIDKEADKIKKELATYPPDRGYPRTGELGAGWKKEIQSLGPRNLLQDIYNEVDYSPFVQRQDSQARIHEGYWKTEAEIAAEYENQIESVLLDEIEKILKG